MRYAFANFDTVKSKVNQMVPHNDVITRTRSFSEETERLLNEHIMMEGKSSAQYLSMASWCDMKGYDHAADFLYRHSQEERMHMLKLFRYVNDAGGHALQPEITGIQHEFVSLREVFEIILEHEIGVTKFINGVADHCFNNRDFTTFNFIQWYVNEQREEETLARKAVDLFDMIPESGIGLFTIERELGKLEAKIGSEMPDLPPEE